MIELVSGGHDDGIFGSGGGGDGRGSSIGSVTMVLVVVVVVEMNGSVGAANCGGG